MRDETLPLASICDYTLGVADLILAETIANLASRLAGATSFVLCSRMVRACRSAVDNKIPIDGINHGRCRLPYLQSVKLPDSVSTTGALKISTSGSECREKVFGVFG